MKYLDEEAFFGLNDLVKVVKDFSSGFFYKDWGGGGISFKRKSLGWWHKKAMARAGYSHAESAWYAKAVGNLTLRIGTNGERSNAEFSVCHMSLPGSTETWRVNFEFERSSELASFIRVLYGKSGVPAGEGTKLGRWKMALYEYIRSQEEVVGALVNPAGDIYIGMQREGYVEVFFVVGEFMESMSLVQPFRVPNLGKGLTDYVVAGNKTTPIFETRNLPSMEDLATTMKGLYVKE